MLFHLKKRHLCGQNMTTNIIPYAANAIGHKLQNQFDDEVSLDIYGIPLVFNSLTTLKGSLPLTDTA